MDHQPRTVGEADENQILQRILPVFRAHADALVGPGAQAAKSPHAPERALPGRTLLGPGDDAAAYDLTGGVTVLSMDTQTQDQDYRLVWPGGHRTTGADLGWKSAAQNLADVVAMGAHPVSLVISLTLPPRTELDFVTDMARGYVEALRELGAGDCTVDGGDLGSGRELSASVAALGLCPGVPVRRSGARPGDVVVLAGTVGRAAAGLDLLLDPRFDPEAAPRELAELARAQLRPRPPLPLGPRLAEAGARAMIDVSDGLVRDAGRLAAASGVRIRLESTALRELRLALGPASDWLERSPDGWLWAGGEDHGLLACLPPQATLPEGAIAIGSCGRMDSTGPAVTIDGEGSAHLGWDHFGAQDRI